MEIDRKLFNEKADLLKLIAHPIRLCILKGLVENGENNVSFMQSCLDVPQSTVSQHLAKLRTAGIIEDNRRGNEVYYKIKDDEVVNIIKLLFNEN